MNGNKKVVPVLLLVVVSVVIATKEIQPGVFRVAEFYSQNATETNYENSMTKTWNFQNNDQKYICLHFTKFNTKFNQDVVTVTYAVVASSSSRKLTYSGDRGSFTSCFPASDLSMTFTSDAKNTASGFQGFVTYSKEEYKPIVKAIVASKVGVRKMAVKGQALKGIQKRSDWFSQSITTTPGTNYYDIFNSPGYYLKYHRQYYTYYFYTYTYSYYDSGYYSSSYYSSGSSSTAGYDSYGYSSSPYYYYAYSYYGSGYYSPSYYSSGSSSPGMIAGICSGIGGLLMFCCCICIRIRLRNRARTPPRQVTQRVQTRMQPQQMRNQHGSSATRNASRHPPNPRTTAIPMPPPPPRGTTVPNSNQVPVATSLDPPPYSAAVVFTPISAIAPAKYEDAVGGLSSSSDSQVSEGTTSTSGSPASSRDEFGMEKFESKESSD